MPSASRNLPKTGKTESTNHPDIDTRNEIEYNPQLSAQNRSKREVQVLRTNQIEVRAKIVESIVQLDNDQSLLTERGW